MMRLEDLTWEEVKEYLKNNQSLLMPIGTCEQHSTHLPLNTDTLVSEKIAEDISQKTHILIAPTITYGVNLPCDVVFSGTTTTTEEALQEADIEHLKVYELYDVAMEDVLTKQKFTRHADESETSVLMYLYPQKVRKDKIVDFETPSDEFMDYLYHRKTDPIPNSPGCQGYPSFATAAKGEQIYKRMKEKVLTAINSSLSSVLG